MKNWPYTLFRFYVDGFKNMKLGKTLWLIIGIKLFIMFFILKLFFFPDILNTKFKTEAQKADFVGKQLIDRK
ncbi:MAG: DUF4492 domain-containing protein [Bacteroidales bacterium]|nr:DUF4492 domain-containing protein [Bacteroidales bacterium]